LERRPARFEDGVDPGGLLGRQFQLADELLALPPLELVGLAGIGREGGPEQGDGTEQDATGVIHGTQGTLEPRSCTVTPRPIPPFTPRQLPRSARPSPGAVHPAAY